ncbi:ElyC/SanA/YdcF family protein [Pasteurella atlantica]|uniref:ElyC/SanA/YdcF family protein n=3 Tax=Pasteurellales TaxID=135625 RepID=A0ACC6HMD3_9PAST|nr:ElyC/SanA/YdcF family protein [Pasteurella atlantica]MDP8033504.1 ElyC/SanA/YdcF family protein [Pasteurella atlantica]MDP8035440.1 ElyC/SanA/YdcF family protein [Pasteurella atlantica]MDP8037391.1 ElyC/SanA/YdcF family protein [Pasteurella atlantica]MDP8047739.1 ElyC/SanA/YdcF family protein [Pasteurella atlantica]MDP8049700.1 ElyC/SanA/YdcF family protein [Pasteurella atlantica]
MKLFNTFSYIIKIIIKVTTIGILLLVAFVILIDFMTGYLVEDKIYTDINTVPQREYAVVLGTAKYFPSGRDNLYYKNRLEAATKLFKNKKVKQFLLSGDNTTPYYNEPKNMTKDLRKKGIPRQFLHQDYAGYNTQSSVIRANKTFHLQNFTIVSQRFHCERALLIAQFHHIDAICFAAEYPQKHYKVRIREYFARVGMFVDFITGKMPKTLKKIKEAKKNS